MGNKFRFQVAMTTGTSVILELTEQDIGKLVDCGQKWLKEQKQKRAKAALKVIKQYKD